MKKNHHIYLDNAATSFPKPKCVYEKINQCIKEYCANPSRSTHALAIKASEEVYCTREEIANHLNFSSPEQVVFTLNATYALNIAIKTTLKQGSHVLISDIEHNAVFRPIYKLAKSNYISYSIFETDGNVKENIEAKIKPNTNAIVCTLASNVTGNKIPLKILSEIREKYNLKLIVDASQEIGHSKIDLGKTPVDILCAPAHKALFGIPGLGFAVFQDKDKRESFIEGGSGFDSKNPEMPILYPENFEAGTLPLPAICSLGEGIRYINAYGIEAVQKRLKSLTDKYQDAIQSLKTVTVYRSGEGIISFSLKDIPSSVIASELDLAGICIRSGLHCAPLVHKKMKTDNLGLARISLSILNKEKDVDKLYKALKEIKSKY